MAKQSKPSEKQEKIVFEAVLRSAAPEASMFAKDAVLNLDTIDHFKPPKGAGRQAAVVLQELGFRVRQVGTFSVSGEGTRRLWEKVFSTKVEMRTQPLHKAYPGAGKITYWSHIAKTPFQIPPALEPFVERAYPQRPPTFFESPLPPRVKYHHLQVPDDVAMICRSHLVHKRGITGKGVLVAMPDTGFYKHPFYLWHGYNYQATLSPDAIRVERDEYGHGTAEAANIFANAPDIDFIGVKMGGNATLAFKTASDLYPAVMTNSWGWDIPGAVLPNYLKPLEAAVIEAVRDRGIVVCFSGGNGQNGFPAQMPDVIAVGGVYAYEDLSGWDFKLEASDYASSFDSLIYPGRHVPDVCGLVGMQPRAIYIMLPVEPGCTIDTTVGGAGYPNKDETSKTDGWTVISGTSAASPQVAGVCALLKQIVPGLPPAVVKAILKASARDVKLGQSYHGQPAGDGHDGATGAGLVDGYAAYQLARSVAIRDRNTVPPPS